MRKKIWLPLLLLALLLISGCHGSQGKKPFEIPETFDESREFELTFWAKNDTNKTQVQIYENAVKSFTELYPNIHVNIRFYTDYGKIRQDVLTNMGTDTTPNVCITYPDHIAEYLEGSEVVVPLNDIFSDRKYGLGGEELLFDSPTVDEIVPEFLEECQLNGYYYAIPYMRSTEACYINKTYVEKLGYEVPDVLTWDYIWEVSDKAAEKGEDGTYLLNGQKTLIPFIYKSTDNMMIQMLRQLDAGYSTDNGEIRIFNDTTRSLLQEISAHVKQGGFSTFKISGYPANFLNAGQCIFAVDSTAGSTWMGSDAPLLDISKDKLVEFETVVRMIPQADPAHPQMISQGPSLCIFNKEDPQEVLASWLFAQFLLTNEVQNAYAETEGYCPVTSKAQNSPEYQDYLSRAGEDNSLYYPVKIEATRLLMENAANTFVTPVFRGSIDLRDASGQMIEEVAKSTRRKKEIDDAYLDDLFEKVTSDYHLDEIIQTESAGEEGRILMKKMPQASRILLGSLAVAWVLIILYVIMDGIRSAVKK